MIAIVLLSASLLISPFSIQRRTPGGPVESGGVSATIALKAGAQSYDFTGTARCRHAPQASIYDAPAEMWSVQQSDGDRRLALTVWRPRSGDSMLTLSVSVGGKQHEVTTVSVGGRGEVKGSGTVTFAAEGKGGTFAIRAKGADGATIAGTVTCAAFTPLVAEGGND